jgi:hypothetical protein
MFLRPPPARRSSGRSQVIVLVMMCFLLPQLYGLSPGRYDPAVHGHIHLVLVVLLQRGSARRPEHVGGQGLSDRAASTGYRRRNTFGVPRLDEVLVTGAERLVGHLLRVPGSAGRRCCSADRRAGRSAPRITMRRALLVVLMAFSSRHAGPVRQVAHNVGLHAGLEGADLGAGHAELVAAASVKPGSNLLGDPQRSRRGRAKVVGGGIVGVSCRWSPR